MFETLELIWTFFVSEELLWGTCLSFDSSFHAFQMEKDDQDDEQKEQMK